MHFKMSSAICFNLDQAKILLSGNGLTLYHTMTTLDAPEENSLLKKADIASIFSFSHNISYPMKDKCNVLNKFDLWMQVLSIGIGLKVCRLVWA